MRYATAGLNLSDRNTIWEIFVGLEQVECYTDQVLALLVAEVLVLDLGTDLDILVTVAIVITAVGEVDIEVLPCTSGTAIDNLGASLATVSMRRGGGSSGRARVHTMVEASCFIRSIQTMDFAFGSLGTVDSFKVLKIRKEVS